MLDPPQQEGAATPLKQDNRRPVPKWLAELDPKALENADFPVREALEHSLYYPAAGFDGRPVQFLGGFIHSFIYVDYGNEEAAVHAETVQQGFAGYHVAGCKPLRECDLTPNGWTPEVPPQYRDDVRRFVDMRETGFVRRPFATWYIFDRNDDKTEDHGPQRFSLVYLCADGVAAYQALYWQHHIAPEVLTIIQPGEGFGGNYANFRDPEGFFAWVVLHGNDQPIPEYLVCGMTLLFAQAQSFWPDEYPEHVEWFQQVNGNGVWRRRGA